MNINQMFRQAMGRENYSLSEHVGEVGKRQEIILCLRAAITMQQGYAVMLYKFTDLDENELVWFASKKAEIAEGCSYRVRATVKRHGQFQGVKQTIINRVKVIGPYIEPVSSHREDGADNITDADVQAAWLAVIQD